MHSTLDNNAEGALGYSLFSMPDVNVRRMQHPSDVAKACRPGRLVSYPARAMHILCHIQGID